MARKPQTQPPKPWGLSVEDLHRRDITIGREVMYVDKYAPSGQQQKKRVESVSLGRKRNGSVRVLVSGAPDVLGHRQPDSPEVPLDLLHEAVDLLAREDF